MQCYSLYQKQNKNTKERKKADMAKSRLVETNQKIAEAVTKGYKKLETGVVEGYQKIEETAVNGFTKIEDKFVDHFLTREGESVEDAKDRLTNEQKTRENKSRKAGI